MPSESATVIPSKQVARRAVAVPERAGVGRGDDPADRRARAGRVEREHLPCLRERPLGVGQPHAGAEHGRQVARVVLDDPVQPLGRENDLGIRQPAPRPLRPAAARPDRAAGRQELRRLGSGRGCDRLHQNRSATPAASSGCCRYGPGTSPQSRGVGITLPGFARWSGSNAQRSFWNAARSSSPNIAGM